jgi:uncharacterized protein YcfJ
MKSAILALAAAMTLSACAMSPEGQGAVTGGVLGGLAGAIIGNNVGDGDARSGAVVGAVVGAGAGAYAGCVRSGRCGGTVQTRRQYYDARSGRYYFRDPRSGALYYENGELFRNQ